MISIHSAEENEFIKSYVKKQPEYSPLVWIGMKRNISQAFRWNDKSPFDYIEWDFNEPNNLEGNETYVEMLIDRKGMWNDIGDYDRAFICQINYVIK
jgi:hypothetical protein